MKGSSWQESESITCPNLWDAESILNAHPHEPGSSWRHLTEALYTWGCSKAQGDFGVFGGVLLTKDECCWQEVSFYFKAQSVAMNFLF